MTDRMTDRETHWDAVYRTRQPTEVSWFQPQPVRSLALIADAGAGPDTRVIDVGGGDSTLVDALMERGFRHVTVLDVSATALERARARLGSRGDDVTWLAADVTRVVLPAGAYDLWHDRAVFHFLVDAEDRRRYVATAGAALRPGGTLVVATFAPDGPTRCSGLEVARYDAESLAREFGDAFALRHGSAEVHHAPSGAEQRFTYAVLQRR